MKAAGVGGLMIRFICANGRLFVALHRIVDLSLLY